MNETKSSVHEAALRHAQRGEATRRSIHVPEWDAMVWTAGFISVAENHRHHRLASSVDEETGEVTVNISEVMARAVIDKLKCGDAEPVFSGEDLSFLVNEAPGDLVTRLYNFVRGEADVSPKKFKVTAG